VEVADKRGGRKRSAIARFFLLISTLHSSQQRRRGKERGKGSKAISPFTFARLQEEERKGGGERLPRLRKAFSFSIRSARKGEEEKGGGDDSHLIRP